MPSSAYLTGACLLLLGLALTPLAHGQPEPLAPPLMPAFDLDALDPEADACENFYQYACGGWHANNPMPPDVSFWSRPFTQFSRQVEDYVRVLIENAADTRADRMPDEQKIGDYYAACMDTTAIEARGLAPLRPELALIDGMDSIAELPTVLGLLQRTMPYLPDHGESFFYVAVQGDPVEGGQAKRLWINPIGLGLYGRDYYLKTDQESVTLRTQYTAHVAKVLQLIGETESSAIQHAEAILALETTLAEARLSNAVLRNNAAASTNLVTSEELHALTPSFRWNDFFRAAGLPEDGRFNASQPAYFQTLDSLLTAIPLDTWQTYLRWHLVAERAHLLPAAFRDAHFDFYGRTVQGQEATPERARACIGFVERDLPNVISRVFSERVFREEMRTQTLEMFEEIKAVMRSRIGRADWMAPGTKQQALAKLEAMRISVSHPETWLDDPRTVVRRDDFYGNAQRIGSAQRQFKFEDLGQPLSIDDWELPATWVGGYYSNTMNAFVVTAAYLLHVADGFGDPAVRYGSLGMLIAHEISHGFDPLGRSYDAEGRQRDWWTKADAAGFEERAQCVVDQFSAFEYAPGIPVDGTYVVSEQVAELAAVSMAWEAYQNTTAGQPQAEVAGFKPGQRLQLANAQAWCSDATDGRWSAMAAGSSSKVWAAPMVHGTVLNLPEFAEAFGCRAGQAMVKPPEAVCTIW